MLRAQENPSDFFKANWEAFKSQQPETSANIEQITLHLIGQNTPQDTIGTSETIPGSGKYY